MLDFTYIDDCVDGIARGVYALAEGRVTNETINLAYGEGNTLVRAAELIAAELGVEPDITMAPSLLGEVTHYVADVTKAHELFDWAPSTPLAEGIPQSVAWFKEWRAAHPEEERPFERPRAADEIDHGFKQPARTAPSAFSRSSGRLRPGKTAVAGLLRDARRRCDLGRLGLALRRAAGPDRAPPLPRAARGVVPLDEEVSVGAYQRLAHDGDRRVSRRRLPLVVGGTGLYLRRRSPSSGCHRRRRPARVLAGGVRRARRRGAHTRCWRARPAAAERVHANDRKRVVRALELTEAGLARAGGTGSGPRRRAPDDDRRARPSTRELDRGSRNARRRWSARGRGGGAGRLGGSRLGDRGKVLGLEQFATLPVEEAVARSRRRRGVWRATSGSGCGACRASLPSTATGLPRRSQMRSSRWNAQGNVYLVTDDGPLTPERARAAVGDADGILDVLATGDDWLEIAIWNPDGSRAEMSGQRHADRRALARRANRRRRR